MQRIFDIVFALLILLLSSPLWLLAATGIFISDFGSPFFLHTRVGREGRPFRLIKFRTMRDNAPTEANLTVSGDRRITPIGRVLRRLKIDELPQLLNVLAGSMSIVGPRPESPEYVAEYTKEQKEILRFRPGLTDPASIKYRYEEKILAKHADPVEAYKTIVLPDKIALSLDYQRRRTFWSDLVIVFQTVAVIFKSAPLPAGNARS
jgi:lipopolysaccharide/colanic/teichoic acid biosynthesis glycosyltransferase